MKTKILSILAILMLIGMAAGAVYVVSNNTATAKMTMFSTHSTDGIETFVSSDGVNFSDSIVVDDVHGGDTVCLTFSHTEYGPNILNGNVVYKIECTEGLTFEDGQIVDFYNDDMNGTEYEKLSGGLVFTNQNDITTNVNTPDHVVIIDNNTAEIRSLVQRIQTFNDTVYTKLNITFNDDAFGEYVISGTVEHTEKQSNPRSGSAPSDEMIATRTIHTKYVNPGSEFNASLTFEALTTIQAPILEEDLPTNWTITEINSSGGYFRGTNNEWIWAIELNAGDKITVDYKINVPDFEESGEYKISGITSTYLFGPYNTTGDDTVTVVVE